MYSRKFSSLHRRVYFSENNPWDIAKVFFFSVIKVDTRHTNLTKTIVSQSSGKRSVSLRQ